MATIHIGPLEDHLEPEQIARVLVLLEDAEIHETGVDGAESLTFELDENALAEIMDLVEANDAQAELYLPASFEEIHGNSPLRIGAIDHLLQILQDIAQDMFSESEDAEDDDPYEEEEPEIEFDREYQGGNMREDHLRTNWQKLTQACKTALEESLAVFISA